MSYINRVILLGSVVDKVKTNSGIRRPFIFTVKTIEEWTDKETKEEHSKEELHNIVVRNSHFADYAYDNLNIGDKVYIEGQIIKNSLNGKVFNDIVVAGNNCKVLKVVK